MGIELNNNPELPMGIQNTNAQRYIYKFSVLCPFCLNAQTNIQCLKDISKQFNRGYVTLVWKFILNNNLKLFTKKDIMEGMDILDISDGVLQDKALTILIMLGFLRKEQQIFTNKNKEEKTRYIYIRNSERKIPPCYNIEEDKHINFNFFRDGIRKNYFNKVKKNE
jgi:hypothetical protein